MVLLRELPRTLRLGFAESTRFRGIVQSSCPHQSLLRAEHTGELRRATTLMVQARNLPKNYIAPLPESLPQPVPPPRERGVRVSNRLTIIATRNIHPGEELTITYCDPDTPRTRRRQFLRENYGFWCHCPRCKREEGEPSQQAEVTGQDVGVQSAIDQMKELSVTHAQGRVGEDSPHIHGHGCSHEH